MLEQHLLIGFSIDVVATLIFTGALFYRRHRRRDLFVIFTFFNLAMFTIVTLITSEAQLGIGASFGLFALLGIIRLRNEEFSNYEIGYFFGCLTLAIVNALVKDAYYLQAFMNATVVLGMALLDSPSLLPGAQHSIVILDAVYGEDAEITRALETLLQAKILKFAVTQVDNVRDMTTVSVNYAKHRKNPPNQRSQHHETLIQRTH